MPNRKKNSPGCPCCGGPPGQCVVTCGARYLPASDFAVTLDVYDSRYETLTGSARFFDYGDGNWTLFGLVDAPATYTDPFVGTVAYSVVWQFHVYCADSEVVLWSNYYDEFATGTRSWAEYATEGDAGFSFQASPPRVVRTGPAFGLHYTKVTIAGPAIPSNPFCHTFRVLGCPQLGADRPLLWARVSVLDGPGGAVLGTATSGPGGLCTVFWDAPSPGDTTTAHVVVSDDYGDRLEYAADLELTAGGSTDLQTTPTADHACLFGVDIPIPKAVAVTSYSAWSETTPLVSGTAVLNEATGCWEFSASHTVMAADTDPQVRVDMPFVLDWTVGDPYNPSACHNVQATYYPPSLGGNPGLHLSCGASFAIPAETHNDLRFPLLVNFYKGGGLPVVYPNTLCRFGGEWILTMTE